MRMLFWILLAAAAPSAWGASPANLLTNGGFESGLNGWRPLWCRQAGAGTLAVDTQIAHGGAASARVQHQGNDDWSFEPELRLSVQPGQVYELECWMRVRGSGSATLCASTWDKAGANVSWSEGESGVHGDQEWRRLRSRFMVAEGVRQIQPRVIGSGAATVWIDDLSLTQKPGLDSLRAGPLPESLSLTNQSLVVSCNPADGTLAIRDRRTGRLWTQKPSGAGMVVTRASARAGEIDLKLLDVPSGLELEAAVKLDGGLPELTVSVSGSGELNRPLAFPNPFLTEAGDRLIVPMNEGISYPVEDKTIELMRLVAYGGHGICMAFWGVTDDHQGQMAIIETPDDAAIRMLRTGGRLAVAPEWDAQKGRLGYARRLRYVFFEQGGHVAMAKRYREHARRSGLLKTLAEKRRENPNVDLLVGAVNVWNWDADPVALAREMQAAGIERILWSRGGSPDALRALNDLKVLTSRYDIYQDVMDPANFRHLRGTHKDWTTAAWPGEIILRANGDWQRGWGVQGTNGEWYSCGVICDSRAIPYARERIPAELAQSPYRCRFIDTTTAAPWNECYSPNHPMTRTESRQWKMKLLDYVSHDLKQVTGCETGHDASVPFLHYFEGMLSLGPYRVPDAGRNMQRILADPPERVAKFQLGQAYRLPLWELVYHDCVVAQWYWGDYNNKLPSLWDKRDLFNVLYGTPPMFMFDRKLWAAQKDRFVQSYRNTCPTARATGYSEMVDHRILTKDRNVQQTVFANGVTVTVNFGETPYSLPSGKTVGALSFVSETAGKR